jgi:membrane-bound serine protease (ClpP class)
MSTFPSAGRTVALCICTVIICFTPARARGDGEAPDRGLWVNVQNPITDVTRDQIEKMISRAKNAPGPKLKKVVFDFNPGDTEAATASWGSCLELARYIQNLNDNGIYTIAFVHNKTTRHTVLPVLACTEIIMSHDAKLGEVVAGPNERVPETDIDVYKKIAGREREAVVLKMIKPDIAVVIGLLGGNPIFVDLDKPFDGVVVPPKNRDNPVLPRGNVGLYNANDATKYRLVRFVFESKQDIAQQYQTSFTDGGIGSGPVKAAKIELVGTIDEAFRQKLFSQLSEVRSKNFNTLFLVLECGGGNAKVAREIADELRDLKNDKKEAVRTIAFIPSKAADLATFIAFGCSEIVMFKGSDKDNEATIGDFEQFLAASKGGDPANNADFIRRNLQEIADARGYEKILVDAMVDRDATVHLAKNRKTGSHELISGPQFEADKNGEKKYTIVKTIKQPGSFLRISASLARELRIAQGTVDNRDVKEVYSMYGVPENDVRDLKPGWLDDFAAFVRRTEISILLVVIAFAGLILEFKMPGATIPGLISLVCFVLFFWAHAYANGQTIYLAIGLFVLGLILLGVEIFILPGFGVTGISGVLLILAGVGLATLEKAPSSAEEWSVFAGRLLQYGLTLFAAAAVAIVFARYLPKIPYANRLLLVPPTDKPDIDAEGLLPGSEQAAALLGQVGTATSMLRPAGMAKFGDHYVDVVTEGDFIEPGTPIQVIEVEGTRIVVKKV